MNPPGSNDYLGALYRRTASRKEMYVDLVEDYFDKRRQQSIVRYSLRRLESLGYTVSIKNQKPLDPIHLRTN
ncbi:hypothetical protein [Pseudalkalibacillus decolorationis]|uniref:hypothetical protein n=1 Tax=Pseudalkalibacillus decolorationis TaxID=163879 RepID=UPI002147BFA0|nr:hypothetical protein [Pseudalkalibacillus decolorationis]